MTVQNTQEERPDESPDQSENMTNMPEEENLAPVTNLRPTVGDELRMRREEAGQRIEDVAEAIRIQKRYLEALEAGRIEDLPGTVYALGFLRTYAGYYGFNGDAFVTRFKEETAGQRREQDYTLPEPIEEARVPAAAIVIVAVVLAVGAYVAWYSLRPQEAEITGAVPEVPAHLATVAEEAPRAAVPAEPAPQPEQAATASVERPAEIPVAAATGADVPAAPGASSPPPPPTAEAVAPVEPARPVTEAPVAETVSVEAPPPAEIVAAAPPVPAVPDTPAAPVVETTVHVPQIYGVGNTGARIVIVAAEDSWIEISDTEGNRLFSRTMRAGDSYRVPNREGLVFVTGNAGGLEITVDGARVPAIGDIGIVRKNVKLDPELLKQGRAWP